MVTAKKCEPEKLALVATLSHHFKRQRLSFCAPLPEMDKRSAYDSACPASDRWNLARRAETVTRTVDSDDEDLPQPPPLLECSLTAAVAPTFCPDTPELRGRHKKNHKKRLVAEAMVLITQMATMVERAENSYKRCQARCALRDTLIERGSSLLETDFITVFRMSPSAVEHLRNKLYPLLRPNLSEDNIRGRCNSNRRPLTVDEKVMIGLMVAGGCPISGIIWGFGVGHSCAEYTAFDFFKAVVESDIGPIEFPYTNNELKVLADGFLLQRPNIPFFIGHVAGLDGLAVRIRMPGTHECKNPLAYVNRKGFASLNVQGLADASVRCRMLSVDTAGSTHDSTAYAAIIFKEMETNFDQVSWN
jgi:hypothetical protein